MRSRTIRYVLVLAILSMIGITIAQVYWVRKAFNQEQDLFHREVNAALTQVATEFYSINSISAPTSKPIKQLTGNYYVVMVNSPIDANLLDNLLKNSFANRNINTDFEYGIYNCDTECMVFDEYVTSGSVPNLEQMNRLPIWGETNYYFGVYFPNKDTYMLNRMEIWTFTSLVMLMVLVFISYTLFVILKQKRLAEVQKDFINNMTHEFKTPISTIEVASEVLQQPNIINEPERLLNYATIINKENRRLKNQVDRVLQLASLENDAIKLTKTDLAINEIISESANHFGTAISEGAIELELKARKDQINGDTLHITNVIYNLIDNAIKYSPNPRIIIKTFNDGVNIVIKVIDNGVGISKDEMRSVFDKFYRVSTGNQHDVKGFGIGLSYVKLVIAEHGGTISLDSELGKGSTFTLILKNEN